ncbi:hypothetical protein RRG08_055245 [Elysia crispata]|uniref:Uncharacterized protein n=1 Tax=Elysia crispata TaxID=231223 RepID=A0AAE0XUY1_9GAST|nr:hypothetical protein RRG08_055245 [Elysia crispata]
MQHRIEREGQWHVKGRNPSVRIVWTSLLCVCSAFRVPALSVPISLLTITLDASRMSSRRARGPMLVCLPLLSFLISFNVSLVTLNENLHQERESGIGNLLAYSSAGRTAAGFFFSFGSSLRFDPILASSSAGRGQSVT